MYGPFFRTTVFGIGVDFPSQMNFAYISSTGHLIACTHNPFENVENIQPGTFSRRNYTIGQFIILPDNYGPLDFLVRVFKPNFILNNSYETEQCGSVYYKSLNIEIPIPEGKDICYIATNTNGRVFGFKYMPVFSKESDDIGVWQSSERQEGKNYGPDVFIGKISNINFEAATSVQQIKNDLKKVNYKFSIKEHAVKWNVTEEVAYYMLYLGIRTLPGNNVDADVLTYKDFNSHTSSSDLMCIKWSKDSLRYIIYWADIGNSSYKKATLELKSLNEPALIKPVIEYVDIGGRRYERDIVLAALEVVDRGLK